MNLTNLKHLILTNIKSIFNFSHLWGMAKEALKLPYAKSYLAVAVLFTGLFIVVTFPYDMLLRNKLKNLEKTLVKTIYVTEIDFNLFDIIAMNNIYMVLRSGSEITIRNADIDISLLRLLFLKDIKGTAQLVGLKYNSDGTQLTFNLNGNIFLDYKSLSGIPQGGDFNVIIENVAFKPGVINLPDSMGGLPLTLPLIKISSIKIDADISGQKINIKNIRIFGKDLNGTITGSVTMSKSIINSRLDLKLTIDPNSSALENYRDLLSRFMNDSNQLVIPVRGSLMMPRVEFPQTESAAPPLPAGSEHPMDKILPVP
ncbi:MAG: hypothetical protein A2176_00560 [Spirochaetes bacterium RBG_13_51_14]|nr:MAG: hypothetical protein A2176_00560 [Spirochaetes bacterium RBG_13_51_14]